MNPWTGNEDAGSGPQGHLGLSLKGTVSLGLSVSAPEDGRIPSPLPQACLSIRDGYFAGPWERASLRGQHLDLSPHFLLSPLQLFLFFHLKFTDLCGLWLVWVSEIAGAFKDSKCTVR